MKSTGKTICAMLNIDIEKVKTNNINLFTDHFIANYYHNVTIGNITLPDNVMQDNI